MILRDYHNPFVKNILDFMGCFVGQIATLENDPEHSFEHPMLRSLIKGLSDVSLDVHVTNNYANHSYFTRNSKMKQRMFL